MPSLAVESPSRHPSQSCHLVHHHRRHHCHRRAVHCHHTFHTHRPFHRRCRRQRHVTVAPSVAVALLLRRPVQPVASPSHHPSPLPLRRHHAPFPLSSLVDCCLFTPPPLPPRLPLPPPLSRLRHRRVATGEAIMVAVGVIIVLPFTPPPCLPSPPPALVDCHISVNSRELYMLK